MDIQTASKRLLKHFRSDSKVVFCLQGPAGIGKSAIVKAACAEAQYDRYVDLRLATQEAGDIVGFPKTSGEFTIWTLPSWWPLKKGQVNPATKAVQERDEKVVIFLDELNRAPQDVRQAVFQLLTEYRMHMHELPEGCKVVVAINPADGVYQVEELDAALNNRMCLLDVTTSAEKFIVWGKENGVYEKLLDFLNVHPELVLQVSKEAKAFPSPRSWTYLSSLYVTKSLEHGDPDEFEVAAGLVGKEAAAALTRFFKENYKKFVTAKELFTKYDEVRERFIQQRDDENYATIGDLVTTLTANEAKTGKKVEDMFRVAARVVHDLPKGDYKTAFVQKMTSKQRQRLLQADPTLGQVISQLVNDARSGQ